MEKVHIIHYMSALTHGAPKTFSRGQGKTETRRSSIFVLVYIDVLSHMLPGDVDRGFAIYLWCRMLWKFPMQSSQMTPSF